MVAEGTSLTKLSLPPGAQPNNMPTRGTISATAEKDGQRMVMSMETEMKMTLSRK